MVVNFGVWNGLAWPANRYMYVRIAPPDLPQALLSFGDASGSGADLQLTAADITNVSASSASWGFMGFGLAGMIGAGVASAVDSLLAPWDLEFSGPCGQASLHAYHGPPPGDAEWALVRQRIAVYEWESTRVPEYPSAAAPFGLDPAIREECERAVEEARRKSPSLVEQVVARNATLVRDRIPEWAYAHHVVALCEDILWGRSFGYRDIDWLGVSDGFLLDMLEVWALTGERGRRFGRTLLKVYRAHFDDEDIPVVAAAVELAITECLSFGCLHEEPRSEEAMRRLGRAHEHLWD
jgi:hypothetical protein